VKTGVQEIHNALETLDSGFRRNDGKRPFPTFYKAKKGHEMERSIVVVAEYSQGEIPPVTYELAAFAKELQQLHPATVRILILGDPIKDMAQGLSEKTGMDVIAIQVPGLRSYTCEAYKKILGDFLLEMSPSYVCVPHTSTGWDYAPALAVRLKAACITGVEGVVRLHKGIGFTRSFYNGKIAAVMASKAVTTLLTLQPGKVKPLSPVSAHPGSLTIHTAACPSDLSRFVERTQIREQSGTLAQAEVIVSAGRGIGKEENLSLISKLAGLFNRSAIGGSRSVCDLGWLEHKQQVGTTGATVTPKLYVACGISGAFQHLVGMSGSEFIVAINTDPNAPIFNVADVCIVDDLTAFIPALMEAHERRLMAS